MHILLLVKETRSAESGPMAEHLLKRKPHPPISFIDPFVFFIVAI